MRLIAICGMLALAGGSTPPRVSVACARLSTDDMMITLQKNSRVNGFLSLRVWEQNADRYLWFVNLNHFPANRLVCGELPVRTPYDHTIQAFPTPPDKPRLPRPEVPFFIATQFQYDSAWPPAVCAADAVFKFQIEQDGSITSLGTVLHGREVFEGVNEPTSEWPQQAPGTLR